MLSSKLIAKAFVKHLPRFGEVAARTLLDDFPDRQLHAQILENGTAHVLGDRLPAMHIHLADHIINDLVKRSEMVAWLTSVGVDKFTAYRIIQWNTDSKALIESNPYFLMPFLGFSKTDKVAQKHFNIAIDDDRRLAALIENTVHSASENGSTLLSLDLLLRRLSATGPEPAKGWISHVKRMVDNKTIIGRPIDGVQYLQTLGHFKMEMAVEDALLTLSNIPVEKSSVEDAINSFESSVGFSLAPEQKEAVATCSGVRVCVVSGGAGTGKTTVLRAVYDALPEDMEVIQIALAGKASLRMTQATGRPAKTIAALLSEMQGKPIQNAFIVIDESSMIDIYTAFRLFKIIGHSCRVLLLGDHFQLPPIGPGLVFHRLCEKDVLPRVLLTQVQRQADSTGIPSLGSSVRSREFPELKTWNGEQVGVYQIPCAEEDITAEAVAAFTEIADEVGLEETQVIAATKEGNGGVKSINRELSGRYSNNFPLSYGIAEGDKILCTKNVYDEGLYNGLTGICRNSVFVAETGSIPINSVLSEHIEPGFAITVHKSQGSQWKAVIVSAKKTKLLDLTLIYTALTRATDLVLFVGDIESVRKAVNSGPVSKKRQVGLFNV